MKIKKSIVSVPPAPPAEITSHPIHPEHKLLLVTTDDVEFECDGCKERGAGGRYTCEHYGEQQQHRDCDFDLHIGCALAPDVLEIPRLFEGCAFVLLHEPRPPLAARCRSAPAAAAASGRRSPPPPGAGVPRPASSSPASSSFPAAPASTLRPRLGVRARNPQIQIQNESSCFVAIVRIRSSTLGSASSVHLLHGLVLLSYGISVAGTGLR